MTLDDCDACFSEALNSSCESEFSRIVEPLFDHYQILSLDWGRGSVFWRARPIEESPFQSISEMIHPPAASARTGRLNDSGVACFYVATRRETAITEIHATEGQRVQIAGFRILPQKSVRLAVIGEYVNVQKRGYMLFGGRDPGGVVSQRLNEMNRAKAKCLLYIDRFFAHVLSDQNARENEYLHSRALSKLIFKRNQAAGIVFPSVRDTGGFNVAIKPAVADKAMHNVCCIVAEVNQSRQFGFVDFEMLSSAHELKDCGSFSWGNESSSDEGFFLYGLTEEESEIARASGDDVNGFIKIVHG